MSKPDAIIRTLSGKQHFEGEMNEDRVSEKIVEIFQNPVHHRRRAEDDTHRGPSEEEGGSSGSER